MKKIIIALLTSAIIMCTSLLSFSADSNNWTLPIYFYGEKIGSYIILGVNENATDGFDHGVDNYYAGSPNDGSNYISGYFERTEWGQVNSLFIRDIKKSGYPKEWSFVVSSNVFEVILKWDAIPGYIDADTITILDVATGEVIDMFSSPTYKYTNSTDGSDRLNEFIISIDKAPPIDTDLDGMTDEWELLYGLNPNLDDSSGDLDQDGLTNIDEFYNGTNPGNSDTDNDGVSDGDELLNGTDPNNPNDPVNNSPTAVADYPAFTVPTLVKMDATASSDPNGEALTFNWTQDVQNPVQVTLTNESIQTFNLAKSGIYMYTLIVSDTVFDSTPLNIFIEVQNVAPSVNAGLNKSVDTNIPVTLNGSASDANGDNINYFWTQAGDQYVTLQRPTTLNPSFIPTEPGVYLFVLTANDGALMGIPDYVVVTVNNPNIVPTADAGNDLTTTVLTEVSLDGSGSTDADNSPGQLTYDWTLESSPEPVTILDVVNPTFTPNTAGIYTFSLIVSDGGLISDIDTVNIVVNNLNILPVANAGVDKIVKINDTVILGGGISADSDSGPEPLTYTWTHISGVNVTLDDNEIMTPKFIPTETGVIVFSLVVFDGELYSLSDEMTVTVEASNNQAPVSNAGGGFDAVIDTVITLDGTGSLDPDGDLLTYSWTRTDGTNITLNNSNTATPNFNTPLPGVYAFSLMVNDGQLNSLLNEVLITVETHANRAPVADISVEKSIFKIGETIIIDGSGSSDLDGDTLTFNWLQTQGDSITLPEITSSQIVFNPDSVGEYNISLVVNDGDVDSTPVSVRFDVIVATGTTNYIKSDQDNDFKTNDGIKLFISKGSVGSNTYLGVYSTNDNISRLPKGKFAASNSINLVPHGLSFSDGLTITIPYDVSVLKELKAQQAKNDELGIKSSPPALSVYTFNKETKEWKYLTYATAYSGDEDEISSEGGTDSEVYFKINKTSQVVVVADVEVVSDDGASAGEPVIGGFIEIMDPLEQIGAGCFISQF